jgi:hypothetical protein
MTPEQINTLKTTIHHIFFNREDLAEFLCVNDRSIHPHFHVGSIFSRRGFYYYYVGGLPIDPISIEEMVRL